MNRGNAAVLQPSIVKYFVANRPFPSVLHTFASILGGLKIRAAMQHFAYTHGHTALKYPAASLVDDHPAQILKSAEIE